MGILYSLSYVDGHLPEYLPERNSKPTFPPEYGFKAPRKQKVSKLTEEELKNSELKPYLRDYCACHYLEYVKCSQRNTPFNYFCKPAKHAYHQCQREEYILRMKEYEREKRLRMRQLRKEGKKVP